VAEGRMRVQTSRIKLPFLTLSKVINRAALRQRAKELRKKATDAENYLWFFLRSRSMGSYKFKRQFIIGPFIADFCCLEKRLVIELDGSQHTEQQKRDSERTDYRASLGFQTLRFWNDDVLCRPQEVLEKIYETLKSLERRTTERKKILYGWGKKS
jgi:very-short-patch-repair endonuclease